MQQNSQIQNQDGVLVVVGELDFSSVIKIWRDSLLLLPQQSELHFDLARVTTSNSAGIALLIEWLKYAEQKNISIYFKNIPSQLLSIMQVSGIEKMCLEDN
jgi:phospholipid transport system transporter-binding protein